MNRLGWVALALTLTVTLSGCPTRPGPNQDGGDGIASTGGHGDAGSTGGTSAGVGGSSGGSAGISGTGGLGTGAGGAGGVGGMTGAEGLGGAGLGGSAGGNASGGVGGNAGSTCTLGACPGNFDCLSETACATTCAARSTAGCTPGYECLNNACVTATVACGSTLCQVGNGEQCCVSFSGSSPTYSCIPAGYCGFPLYCDSGADCPSGQICCGTTNGSGFGTSCTTPQSCQGGTLFSAFQVCDPDLTPTECITGSCTGTFSLDPALHTCK